MNRMILFETVDKISRIFMALVLIIISANVGAPVINHLFTHLAPPGNVSKSYEIFKVNCTAFLHDDIIKYKYFLVTDPLSGEFTGHHWILLTKASDVELWCFLRCTPEQTVE